MGREGRTLTAEAQSTIDAVHDTARADTEGATSLVGQGYLQPGSTPGLAATRP
jgi:hypothetical protein